MKRIQQALRLLRRLMLRNKSKRLYYKWRLFAFSETKPVSDRKNADIMKISAKNVNPATAGGLSL